MYIYQQGATKAGIRKNTEKVENAVREEPRLRRKTGCEESQHSEKTRLLRTGNGENPMGEIV
jgi:hypothetical protein